MRTLLVAWSLAMACNVTPPVAPEDGLDGFDGIGSEGWEAAADISCGGLDDCQSGEVCKEGFCTLKACDQIGRNSTAPPLGSLFRLADESEIAVADAEPYGGSYFVDLYAPNGSAVQFESSERVFDRPTVDLAGGVFRAGGIGAYAAASQARSVITFTDSDVTLDVSFSPAAVTSGDVDGDGVDELIAVNGNGDIAVCSAEMGVCDQWGFGGGLVVVDAAAGDLDADGLDEVVLLYEVGGSRYLQGINLDAEASGQVDGWFVGTNESGNPTRVEVADTDGDGQAEVFGLWDSCLWDLCDDEIHQWVAIDQGGDGTFAFVQSLDMLDVDEAIDFAFGDTDGDDSVEVAVLDAENRTHLYSVATGSLSLRTSRVVTQTASASFIALADHDGDAPVATLEEAQECEGNVIPMMQLLLPPYDRRYSDGVSSAGFGEYGNTSEALTDTVSLHLGVDVGVGASFFDLFGGKLGVKMGAGVSEADTRTTSSSVGGRYSVQAQPDLHGVTHGAVVVAYGCFDAYRYSYDDPAGIIEGAFDGEDLVLTAPAGGGMTLWSSARYNAMAEHWGLPELSFPFTLGDPDSYPTTPSRLDGSALPDTELVMPISPAYRVSDIGDVSWWLNVSESTGHSESRDYDFGGSAGVTAYGINVSMSASRGWGSGYSLTTGASALFSGTIPPMPDDPDTPEDEHANNAYSVRPYVYLQRYTNEAGDEGAYYVMTYAVER